MPSVPAYIRNQDWELYMAIKQGGPSAWAEFIHKALNTGSGTIDKLRRDNQRKVLEKAKTPTAVQRVKEIDEKIIKPSEAAEAAQTQVLMNKVSHKNYLKPSKKQS